MNPIPDWAEWMATESNGDILVFGSEPVLEEIAGVVANADGTDYVFGPDVLAWEPSEDGTCWKMIATGPPPADWTATKRRINRRGQMAFNFGYSERGRRGEE